MSSQTRNTREDTNRLDLRTLAIASFSAAVAAVVVSRIWASGTPIAAAATPVVVTIIKEMLDRPTAKIAEKVTVNARALPATEVREPAASHVGRDAQLDEGPTRRLEPTEPIHPESSGDPGDIRVYRQQSGGGGVFSRIKPKVVVLTAVLAFLIAGVVLTAGQLAIGNPFGDDGNGAIILGGGKNSSKNSSEQEQQNTTTEPQQTAPAEQQQTTPDQQQTAPVEPEEEQQQPQQQQRLAPTPTTPQSTTPAPAPGSVQP